MLKSALVIGLFVVGLNAFAAGDGDHSETICSAVDAKVCAHLGHMTKDASTGEAQFIAHAMIPQNQEVSDMKVVLWMPSMGHGSSPVTLTKVGVNKYQVTEAYFMMPGQWEVRLSFSLNGANHKINIPVAVE